MGIKTQAFVGLLAYWVYQNARWTYNTLVLAPLPHSYFAGGDANTTCKNVRGELSDPIAFCEDATMWNTKVASKLLISCDTNRLEWNTVMGPLKDPNPKGAIWVYDFEKPSDTSVHRLQLDGFPETSDFHPLGIDVLPATTTEPAHLFIVNHGRNFSTIEQFKLSDGLKAPYHGQYVRTWAHKKAIHAPNAIIPLSPNSLYVTNDHTLTRRLPNPWGEILPLVETVLVLPGGWVDYLEWASDDEIKVTRAISRVPFANGIALSPDGNEVAVVSTTEGSVRLYDRDASTNVLTFRESVFLPFVPDNVAYDETKGSITVGGHPHFPSMIDLVDKKTTKAPSWAVELQKREIADVSIKYDSAAPYPAYKRANKHLTYDITTLYQSNGEHYSTSASAVQHGKNLFIAGLYGDGLLHCAAA